jgi:hypothetical protein
MRRPERDKSWSETPALIESRYTDVLAANSLMLALAPYYAVGTNRVRAIFFDPRVRDMYEDWETVTERAVAELQALVGPECRRPPPQRAGRRALGPQRALSPALGAARRPPEAQRHGPGQSPTARPAGTELRKSADPRHRRPDTGRLPRRARQPERPGARPAGQHGGQRQRRATSDGTPVRLTSTRRPRARTSAVSRDNGPRVTRVAIDPIWPSG